MEQKTQNKKPTPPEIEDLHHFFEGKTVPKIMATGIEEEIQILLQMWDAKSEEERKETIKRKKEVIKDSCVYFKSHEE